MKRWIRLPLLVVVAAATAALMYPLLVVVFEGGRGLGQPRWYGFALQALYWFVVCLIMLGVVITPTIILSERYLKSPRAAILVSYIVATVSLMTVFVFFSGTTLGGIMPSATGASVLAIIQYTTKEWSGRE